MTDVQPSDALAGRLLRGLVLPLALIAMINAIDRVNISYAANAMMRDLHFGPQAFGTGVSAFFVGYLLFQYPHAALLRRVGMKAWLAGSLLLWGLIGVGMAFVQDTWQFYGLRFLLGVAEAGFAPGVTYIVGLWVPMAFRARAMGVILSAIPATLVLGGPLCGGMLGLANPLQLEPWRFMFLMQALPNLLLVVAALSYFVDRPAEALWLTPADREVLAAADDAPAAAATTPMSMLRDPRVLACAACWFCVMTGGFALIFWVPQLVRQLNPSGDELTIGLTSAIPQIGVVVGMLLNAAHSDRTRERLAHFAFAALLAGLALLVASRVSNPVALLALLALAGAGIGGAQGVFWTLPAALGIGAGRAPVGVITVLNMGGTAGGILGPVLLGAIRESTGSFAAGIAALATLLMLAVPITLWQRRRLVPGVAPGT
jgi:ACS family tartrate transporter-like MFS transporter